MKLSDYAKRLAATSDARDRSDRSEDEIALAGSFEVSFRDVEREYPASAALMTLCAFLAPDDIPLEVIRDGAEYLPEPLQAACTSPEAFNAAVVPLLRYALARRDGEALFVHRIVQRLVRERLSGKERGRWAGCASQLLNAALPATSIEIFDPDIGRIYDRLAPHGLTAAAHAEAAAVVPRETARLFANIGVHQQVRGDLSLARPNLERALALFQGLVAANPSNAGWQRDLSVSHNRIGDVLRAQGDLTAALESYRASLAIAERLAAADPGNAGWQRDLSVSHNKIGDVLVAQGDLTAALESYRASLAIAERLAAADPGNAGWQRDLSVSHERIGDVLRAQGDLTAALESYRASLAIRERLAKSDPGNAGWQRDLSVSQERIGDVLVEQGDETKRSDGRAAEYQSFQTMVFEPFKPADLVLKGASLGVEIAAHVAEPVFSAWKAYMASMIGYTHNMARFVWQTTAYPWNKDLDNWLAAEKYSRSIAALATIVPSASEVYVSTLASEGTYQKYFDYVRQLAHEMWMRSIISQSSTLERDVWVAAERHLLIIMGAALRTAESVDEATYILTRLFENFDPVLHLARIEKEAYSLWEARSRPLRDALRDWIKAEDAILAQIGKGEIKAIASRDTER